MEFYNFNKVAAFDVDDTLILYDYETHAGDERITIEFTNGILKHFETVGIHKKHLNFLKKCGIDSNTTVIVWSMQGGDWAKAVVEALGIEEYVDICMGKPTVLIDDLPLEQALGRRIYLENK